MFFTTNTINGLKTLQNYGFMKILIIDNYDSFTYNLVHYLEDLNCNVTIKRNDQLHIDEVNDYDKIILSPGPGLPNQAGLLKEIIKKYAHTKPILGICLGQQAIAEVFGGSLLNLNEVKHGVSSVITQCTPNEGLFKNLPIKFKAGRYHSWVVNPTLPECLIATSFDENGNIMSLKHSFLNIKGVQFHPESILTPFGKQILQNWIEN